MKRHIRKVVIAFLFSTVILLCGLLGQNKVYAADEKNSDVQAEYIYVRTTCYGDDVYHEGVCCKMVATGTNLQYKWFAQKDSDKSWSEISEWDDSAWLYWTPDTYGTYVITCMVREVNKADTMKYKSIRYTYCPKLKGVCQIPNPEGDGGFLIGLESFDNDNYSYEMLILDVELYEQGKDAWIYTTGKCKSDQNCMWTVWQPKEGVYWTLFRIYNSQDEIIDERCFGFINTTDSSYPVDHEEQQDICPDFGNDDVDVTKYSYEIIPLLPPFDGYFYVKTDNPNPEYVRFVDKESKYYDEEDLKKDVPCAIRYSTRRFSDVVYEDYDSGRVNGGYIFVRDTGYHMDGGELVLQQADRPYKVSYHDDSISSNSPNYTDTEVVVSCPAVMSDVQYLIDTYTSPKKDLFDNLYSVQGALYNISLYPKGVLDTTRQNGEHPYPFLATSPYYELSLNEHYEIYERGDLFLAECVHPYVLHSLGFPGMIASVAKQLQPDCVIERGDVHYLIKVTYNGITKSYGGSGNGTPDDFYSKYIEKLYTFDGAPDDFAYNATMDKIYEKYMNYMKKTNSDLAELKDQISGENSTFFNKTGSGTWIRVAREYYSGKDYTYVTQVYGNYSSDFEDVWVDGRYINIYNAFNEGVKYGDIVTNGSKQIDTSKSDIIIRNVSFVDYYGNPVTRDAYYKYNSLKDIWEAYNTYVNRGWYSSSTVLPDELILTREEVDAMNARGELDCNTDILPTEGLIYDGTVEPGTPFVN